MEKDIIFTRIDNDDEIEMNLHIEYTVNEGYPAHNNCITDQAYPSEPFSIDIDKITDIETGQEIILNDDELAEIITDIILDKAYDYDNDKFESIY